MTFILMKLEKLLFLIIITSGCSKETLHKSAYSEFTIPAHKEGIIKLSDGRDLAYAEFGLVSGLPVFYFHGGQESRLSSAFMDSTAASLGIRIIATDRPGIGNSSFQEGRKFLDWPKDVGELADSLSIDQFYILGLSGGSPHVLACLHQMPHRVLQASIVSGAAPYNYSGALKGVWFPVKIIHWFASWDGKKALSSFIKNDAEGLKKKPENRMNQFQNYLPLPDKELMIAHPEYGYEFIRGSEESYKQGIDAVVQEWRMYVRDWGFELSEIKHPVNLWYGTKDKMVPSSKGLYLQSRLTNSRLHILENEAHFSLIRKHLKEILSELTSTNADLQQD